MKLNHGMTDEGSLSKNIYYTFFPRYENNKDEIMELILVLLEKGHGGMLKLANKLLLSKKVINWEVRYVFTVVAVVVVVIVVILLLSLFHSIICLLVALSLVL